MKSSRAWMLVCCLLLMGQGASAGSASPAAQIPTWVLKSPPGPQDSTISARLKACLLLGDMQCVVHQYMLLKDLGRMPGWLVAFQNAFAVANRRAGECSKVAQTIHQGLVEFEQQPVFIHFKVEGGTFQNIGFDLVENGVVVRNMQISTNGYHVAVKLGGRIIDAYTGLAGLPLTEYLNRLSTFPGSHITQQVSETL